MMDMKLSDACFLEFAGLNVIVDNLESVVHL